MRAVVRDEYGGPDMLKIEEIDKPELVDDGVLVRVRAAALNPTDYVLMRGFSPGPISPPGYDRHSPATTASARTGRAVLALAVLRS